MKRGSVLALVAVVTFSAGAALWAAPARAQAGTSRAARLQAESLFKEGKRLHDSRDYARALETFREGARLEPTRARWPYNQALALRKLRRKQEAIEAFLQARALEPDYRRADVTRRLMELGYRDPPAPPPGLGDTSSATPGAQPHLDPSASDSQGTPAVRDSPPAAAPVPGTALQRDTASDEPTTADGILGLCICFGCPGLGLFGLGYGIYRLTRKKGAAPGSGWPQQQGGASHGPADVEARAARLAQVSERLVQVEHALRLGEDDDARALLNRATLAEQRAYEALALARRGKKGSLPTVDLALQEAEAAASQAEARAQEAFGPLAFSGQGERVGCYFCARPLANSDFRVQVPLKQGQGTEAVLACRPCSNQVAAGQAPEVLVHQEGKRQLHWSELPDFDPYLHRHRPYAGSRSVPAYDFTPQRSLGELAAMAAGGAVVGGLAAYGVGQLLDLDGAREAAAAQAAAQAAAMRASEERSSSSSDYGSSSTDSWRDHS